MNDCDTCDGWGIMTLWSGQRPIQAPCLKCSADQNLNELERRKEEAQQRARITEHNARVAGL